MLTSEALNDEVPVLERHDDDDAAHHHNIFPKVAHRHLFPKASSCLSKTKTSPWLFLNCLV